MSTAFVLNPVAWRDWNLPSPALEGPGTSPAQPSPDQTSGTSVVSLAASTGFCVGEGSFPGSSGSS